MLLGVVARLSLLRLSKNPSHLTAGKGQVAGYVHTQRQVSLGSFSTFPAERNEKMQFRKSPSLRGCEAEDPRKKVRVLSCTF